MSKTLKLKPVVIPSYTADELRAMLAELVPEKTASEGILDATAGLPVFASKDAVVPGSTDAMAKALVQAPPAIHGSMTLNGIPVLASPINVNPATGLAFNQVVTPSRGGSISPPPTRNFR